MPAPLSYIREAATLVKSASSRCLRAIDLAQDTPTRLPLGQAVLRLREAADELASALDNAREAEGTETEHDVTKEPY